MKTPLLALLLLALPAAAQGGDPLDRPLTSDPAPPLVPFEPNLDGLLARAEPPATALFTRARLEGASESTLKFEEVPGGVVLGLEARSLLGAPIAGLACDAAGRPRLVLGDGRELALPDVDPALLLSCLRFATESASHWAVDILVDGEVVLARPLLDTPAGLVVVRADLAPFLFLPAGVTSKSTLVDGDVRVVADGERAALEADLELRLYGPALRAGGREGVQRAATLSLHHAGRDGRGRPRLAAPQGAERGAELLAENLSELAEVAGWVALLRHVHAARPGGLDELRAVLEGQPRQAASTPRRILHKERAAWVRGGASSATAEIPEWMREWARTHDKGAR